MTGDCVTFYTSIVGRIKVGEGVEYRAKATKPFAHFLVGDEFPGMTSPVIEYDEATEIFITRDGVYAPA